MSFKKLLSGFIVSAAALSAKAGVEIRPVLDAENPNAVALVDEESGATFWVEKTPVVGVDDLASANTWVSKGQAFVGIKLTDDGAKKIQKFTRDHIGERMALVVDGRLIKAPTIRDPIRGSALQIEPLDKTTARQVAKAINHKTIH